MIITVAKGTFSSKDAEELITKMIHVKIVYHENRIKAAGDNAEESKIREKRIIQLQKELFELRRYLQHNPGEINLDAEIELSGSGTQMHNRLLK